MNRIRRKRKRADEERLGVGGYIVLIILLILCLFPVYWMINISIKPLREWLAMPQTFYPQDPTTLNYIYIVDPEYYINKLVELQEARFGEELHFETARGLGSLEAFLDSAILVSGGTALALIVGVLAALAISRHKFGGSAFPLFVLSVRMFPPAVAIIPLIVLYSTIRMIDTHIGLILAYAVYTCPYAVWMTKSFIDEIPEELEESAMVDGTSRLEAHFRITLPLIRGGIVATALFLIILNYSEFMLALVLGVKNVVTIPVYLGQFVAGTYGVLYGPQSALAVVAVIPILAFSYVIQKHLVRGLTFGAVKR